MAKTVYVKPRYSWRDRKIKRSYYKNKQNLKDAREAIERGSRLSKELFGDSYATASIPQKRMRRALNFKGEGDYEAFKPWLKWGSRGIGAALSAAPVALSGRWGDVIKAGEEGWKAGSTFSKSMGWGDYTTPMISNQIMDGPSNVTSDTPVVVNHMGDLSGDIILQHREFIQNVTVTNSGLEQQQFELNPGVKATFPFLSQIANNFELYEFEGLAFQFVPHYGEGEDSILGKVVMVTNYDPDARPFRTSQEMQNYDYASTAKPSLGQVHGIETASNKRATDMLYVRSGSTPRDKVFTDIGKFTLATEGIPKSGNIGELWVTYKIRLSRAHLNDVFRESTYQTNIAYITGTLNSFTQSGTEDCVVSQTSNKSMKVTFPVEPEATYFVSIIYCQGPTARLIPNKITQIGTALQFLSEFCPGSTGSVINPNGNDTEYGAQVLLRNTTLKEASVTFTSEEDIWDGTSDVKQTVIIVKRPSDLNLIDY